MHIHPFSSLLPPPGRAAQVASLPYDTVSTEEAAAWARERPVSFLHVTRPEVDLPPGTDPRDESAHRQARCAFEHFRHAGLLRPDGEPSLYLYRMAGNGHRQLGLVACCDVSDYRSGLIRCHKRTHTEREIDRARHMLATGAHTEPVLLAHRDDPEIEEHAREDSNERPLFHFRAPDGITHSVWRAHRVEHYLRRFEAIGPAWIADGHHRSAAAARVAEALPDNPEAASFLALLVPVSQLRILPCHRLVRTLGDLTPEVFMKQLAAIGDLTPVERDAPTRRGAVRVFTGDRWHELELPRGAEPGTPEGLDVSLLQAHVLHPLLGIRDPADPRMQYIGGAGAMETLERAVRSGCAAVAFVMHPTSVEEVISIADRGGTVPPKSTWFDPKPRSGLFVHPFT